MQPPLSLTGGSVFFPEKKTCLTDWRIETVSYSCADPVENRAAVKRAEDDRGDGCDAQDTASRRNSKRSVGNRRSDRRSRSTPRVKSKRSSDACPLSLSARSSSGTFPPPRSWPLAGRNRWPWSVSATSRTARTSLGKRSLRD